MSNVYVDKLKYKKRIVDDVLDRYLNVYGAVCLEGPKYCGKTLTSLHFCKSGFDVGSPKNHYNNKALTNLSPFKVLEGPTPRLLVEWEEAPILWNTVNQEVDNRMKKGQFIMTNSFRPKMKSQDLSTRIHKIQMRTMSLYETGDSSGQISLEDICNGNFNQVLTGEVDLTQLAYYIVRGGWPDNLDEDMDKFNSVTNAYLKEIIKKDVEKFDGKKYDASKMMLLINALAKNEGTIATNTKLLKDIKNINKSVDINTITTYIDIFARTYLTDNQPAFDKDIKAPIRVKQADRRHFCDTAITCALLGLTPQKLMSNVQIFETLFKSLCVHDLKIYAESFEAKVSHYEDYSCRTYDAVVEMPNNKWCAFDIRLGVGDVDKAASEMLELRNDIKNNGGQVPSVMCVICAMSNTAYKRADGIYVVPITALKN